MAQVGVGDLPAAMDVAEGLRTVREPRVAEGEAKGFVAGVEAGADESLERRPPLECRLHPLADSAVGAWDHPRRRSLKEGEVRYLGLDRRYYLNRRRARPDDGDALPGEVEIVVPPRRVEGGAREAVEAGDGRDERFGERAGRGHEHVGGPVAAARGEAPAGGLVVPHGLRHVVIVADMLGDAPPLGHVAEVGPDLGLWRETSAPTRVRRERELVEVRLHVAGGAGVRVVAPHAAEVVGPFEEHEVVEALLTQPHGRADPAEAGPHDRDAGVGGGSSGQHGTASVDGEDGVLTRKIVAGVRFSSPPRRVRRGRAVG